MPFRECSIMSEREEFCRLWERGGVSVRDLCRRFGVSPTTGYKWRARWRAEGSSGLVNRSSRPHASPLRSSAAVESEVLACRTHHPVWGGRKIRRVLQNDGLTPPAASTITAILRRHGQLNGPGAGEARDWQRFESAQPNDLWQMDFKGHMPMTTGRLHPLTVLDDCSRYALTLAACAHEQGEGVKALLKNTFLRYGLPRRILADNGSPWGAGGGGELTRFAIWLMDLDITLIHGRPYHPQTQGKDERFHRTLKAEVLQGRRFAGLEEAQQAFDDWRQIYNTRRPHEALGLDVPAQHYRASPRAMPERIDPPEYAPGLPVRKVDAGGKISFQNRVIKCPKAFIGQRIALRATQTDGIFDLCYRRHTLAQIDLRDKIIQTVHKVPEHPSTTSPV